MTLFELLLDAVAAAPDGLAVVTESESVTFAELVARVETRAAQIVGMTAPGDRVAVLAENCAEYVELYYAVPRAGRILVPLNHRLHPEEWRATLAASGATVLFGEPALLERATATVGHIVPFTSTDPAFVTSGASRAPEVTNAGEIGERSADDVAWLIGTSGTTGTPKLAMLSDANLLAAVDATLPARPVGDHDVLLTPFPLCHVAGYNVFVAHRRARPIVLQRSFDPVGLAGLVRRHAVTMLSLAPTMITMLLDHPDVQDADLATVARVGVWRVADSRAHVAARDRPLELGLLARVRHDRARRQRRVSRTRRPSRRGSRRRATSRGRRKTVARCRGTPW